MSSSYVTEIALGLGSNIGKREKNLLVAIEHLKSKFGTDCTLSKIYQSDPVDYLKQPTFLNMAILFKYKGQLKPLDVLNTTQAIEKLMGRNKTIPKGPRNIDIDILYLDDVTVDTTELTIPHPAIFQRDFVKLPLLDISTSFTNIKIPKLLINGTTTLCVK